MAGWIKVILPCKTISQNQTRLTQSLSYVTPQITRPPLLRTYNLSFALRLTRREERESVAVGPSI